MISPNTGSVNVPSAGRAVIENVTGSAITPGVVMLSAGTLPPLLTEVVRTDRPRAGPVSSATV